MFESEEEKEGNLHSSSLRSRGDKPFLFGIGLTGAATVGFVVLLLFCVVDLGVTVVVVAGALVVFLSPGGSVGFVRGAVGLTTGLAGRFSVLIQSMTNLSKRREFLPNIFYPNIAC